MSRYVVGITGASGSLYAVRLIEELLKLEHEIFLVISDSGRMVLEYETNRNLDELIKYYESLKGNIKLFDINDYFAPIASGSFEIDGMVILPCTMGTLAKIANGSSDNLLVRASDVCIKEKRNLIVVPRETPLSTIHLKNMLSLSEIGVMILPAMPNFYHKPKTIEDIVSSIVGRVMKSLGIKNNLYKEWNGGI